jgi:hypothetical protein
MIAEPPIIPRKEVIMAEVVTRLPLSLDDIMTLASDKQIGASVELATRKIIEKTGTGGKEAYLLSADFRFRINNESYMVSIPYLVGEQAETPEVAVANRKIANSRLRRDYRRLHSAGIEIDPRYFEEFVASRS